MKTLRTISKTMIMLFALQFAGLGVVSAKEFGNDFYAGGRAGFQHQSEFKWRNSLSQNRQSELRSRSDVVREVKRRYDAEVLRISLSKNGRVYNVRVLMPNGKVRNIQVNAQR